VGFCEANETRDNEIVTPRRLKKEPAIQSIGAEAAAPIFSWGGNVV